MGQPLRQVGLELMPSIAFVTIGCKLNRFETEQMRETAQREGFVCSEADGAFDVCVINTCTVTSKSDYRSRQAVRRAVRANPEARIVVTGCYAQRFPEELASIDGVDAVIGNREKEDIARYLKGLHLDGPLVAVAAAESFHMLPAPTRLHGFGDYTRAFVKIQDGCDNRCSYCAVPLARGGSRSKPTESVVDEITILAGAGYREVVLTGVHLGSYGRDLSPVTSLPDLLQAIAEVPGLERVRLSSIEPTDFSARLIEVMADPAMKICPHVHVPLQSGDDGILRRMGRPYTAARYTAIVRSISAAVPHCGIGADVMVGFPGEDDAAFNHTRALVEALPITYLHVFAYSKRKGTPASTLRDQVEPDVKKTRSKILRDLGKAKSQAFRTALEGETLQALVLKRKAADLTAALSGNYVKTYFREPLEPGRIVPARVAGICRDGVLATVRASGG
jgi:threonylcarbamoyladenosine tRNA methylthiotransferase MtaB